MKKPYTMYLVFDGRGEDGEFCGAFSDLAIARERAKARKFDRGWVETRGFSTKRELEDILEDDVSDEMMEEFKS